MSKHRYPMAYASGAWCPTTEHYANDSEDKLHKQRVITLKVDEPVEISILHDDLNLWYRRHYRYIPTTGTAALSLPCIGSRCAPANYLTESTGTSTKK